MAQTRRTEQPLPQAVMFTVEKESTSRGREKHLENHREVNP